MLHQIIKIVDMYAVPSSSKGWSTVYAVKSTTQIDHVSYRQVWKTLRQTYPKMEPTICVTELFCLIFYSLGYYEWVATRPHGAYAGVLSPVN